MSIQFTKYVLVTLVVVVLHSISFGDEGKPSLAAREQQLLQQFRDLERSFLRLADLLSGSDPRRATLLRSVFAQAREAEVGDRLDTIVSLLEKKQLLKAGSSQSAAIDRMKELLSVLEAGNSDQNLSNTKEEVKKFIARVSKLIAKQRGLEGKTEFGSEEEGDLSNRQEEIAEETRDLAGDVSGFAKRMEPVEPMRDEQSQDGQSQDGQSQDGQSQDGQSQDGQSQDGQSQDGQSQDGQSQDGQSQDGQSQDGQSQDDGDDEVSRARRTRSRLHEAEKRMREAEKRLDEANRPDALIDQQKALEELETARAELEEILRQMREQEVEQLLVQLETRIRAMLRIERGVVSGVESVAGEKEGSRERQLEAARLSREQTKVTVEVTKALVLVRDDGSAVAIPQALEQIRDDSVQVSRQLFRGDVGNTTKGVLGEIVTGLEELLAALEQAQREQQQEQGNNPSGGRPPQPGEQPLVDKLAELKMIRSLQMRINSRTQRFSQLLDEGVERAVEPELIHALDRLAERQRLIQQAAHDIVSGRTE